jgi:alpha-tubulin suppressor-like RCC1 family protein
MAAVMAGCGGVVAVSPGADSGPRPDAQDAATDAATYPTPMERCPMAPPPLPLAATEPSVVSMSLSMLTECAVYRDGTLRCRGNNTYGQLGSGRVDEPAETPRVVEGLSGVRQVWVQEGGSVLSLHEDGTVRAWGLLRFGNLGLPDAPDQCQGVPCSLRPRVIPALHDIVALGGSLLGSCALERGGPVWCWGLTAFGNGSSTGAPVRIDSLSNVRELIDATGSVLAWQQDGTLMDGSSTSGFFGASIPPSWVVAPGMAGHLCATLPDGTLRCWGANLRSQLGIANMTDPAVFRVPGDPGLDCVRSAARADYHTCAVRTDGTVWCWGRNDEGESGAPETENGPCPGGGGRFCVLRPRRVEGIDQVGSVFVGTGRSCAIRTDRTVWCWGSAYGTVGRRPLPPSRTDW